VPPSPPTPAERFSAILLWLAKAVAARSGAGLPFPLIGLIVERLRRIKQRFADIAARVGAGSYRPRRHRAGPRPGQKPPPPDKLPKHPGWLLPLVPDAVAYRSQLEQLLADPEMADLLAAAPASLRRPLRSLCRMLAIPPPPQLAPPPSVRPETAAPPEARERSATKPPGRPGRPRYVFGLRYPPPFPNPT
jgi:hypothetical protein